jgi:hypothetical protein
MRKGLLKRQTAAGHLLPSSSGRRMGTSASAWTTGNRTTSQRKTFPLPLIDDTLASQTKTFPLPLIDDTLDMLVGAKWFSTLDLKSGYLQVNLHEDKEKTAFSMGQGLWQFTIMPFGICNTPATFELLMEKVIRGLSYESCLMHLDDVIVIGRTFQEHLLNLRNVFQRFLEARLELSREKCQLFQKKVPYLRHIVSPEG